MTATTTSTVDSSPAGTTTISVTPVGGEAYDVHIGAHSVLVDQPVSAGGAGAAPTPTELFIGSLAGCVAYYAGRYLTRHGFSRDGLRVEASYTMATDRPARVSDIRLRVRVPADVPAQRRAALQAVASHCTVHNTISGDPNVTVDLEDE